MKTSEFIRTILVPSGAVLIRKRGSHHVYKLKSGRIFQLPVGGRDHTEMADGKLAHYHRLARDTSKQAP